MISREEYLNSLDFLNLSSALEGVGGDFESYLSVLKVYCEVGKETSDSISREFNNKDYLNLRIAVHGLKSSSYVIGAKDFGDFCKKMEFYCRDIENNSQVEEAVAGLDDGIPVLLTQYAFLLDKLNVVFTDTSEVPYEDRKLGINVHKDGTVLADSTFFEQKIEQAINALNDFDLDCLDSILAELGQIQLDAVRSKTLEDIKSAISVFDYDLVDHLLHSFD